MELQTESLMKSASRSFIKGLMIILGFVIGLGAVVFLASAFMSNHLLTPPAVATLLPDSHGGRKLLPMHTPALLVLRIDNVIGVGDLTTQKFKDLLLDSRSDLFEGDRLKGILLYINSPGGSAVDSDNIYSALTRYKEDYKVPIFSFVDGLCASGGMYIAAASDKIMATPTSTIGSIGVRFGPAFNVSQTLDRYGITSLTFTEGKDKDMLNPFRPWGPTEGDSFKAVLAAMYERFVHIVLKSRTQMTKEDLVKDYGAHVFIAEEAKLKGYIDEATSSYESSIEALARAAGIQDGDAYQVIELSTPHSIFEQFSQAKLETLFRNLLGLPQQELQGKLLLM